MPDNFEQPQCHKSVFCDVSALSVLCIFFTERSRSGGSCSSSYHLSSILLSHFLQCL